MASHMGVQRHATARNEQVELLVDFTLRLLAERLHREGRIEAPECPTLHKQFERPDCSDVFDHYVRLDLRRPVNGVTGGLELWAQTTCYKGNQTGKPEANKTYEVRETLVESLGLRRWLREEGIPFRTIHLTIGPAGYTYGWFTAAKGNAFDLSLYPAEGLQPGDLFQELSSLSAGAQDERECRVRLRQVAASQQTPVGALICSVTQQLYEWFVRGLSTSPLADQQADLLARLSGDREQLAAAAVAASKRGGAGIKERAIELLEGEGQTDDPAMQQTLSRLVRGNPFLAAALVAERDWSSWSEQHFAVPDSCLDLTPYVSHLWQAERSSRDIIRRLVLRIHTDESISYIQDIGVGGISEHNLYDGDHTPQQIAQIIARIVASCEDAGISTPRALYSLLVSKRARRILRDSRKIEVRNGTEIKPSFIYVEESLGLTGRYKLIPLAKTSLPAPIAYHAEFARSDTKPYTNLMAVVDTVTHQPLAIIKAKFFRQPEFPRRVKEETYVGLTTRFQYEGGAFTERYGNMPLIMFVDMAEQTCPPEYAVRRLVTAGWDVFFSVDELRAFLDALAEENKQRRVGLQAPTLFDP